MKIAIILACVAVGAFAFSHEDINFDEIVPIYETVEFKQQYPHYAYLAEEHRREGRIWNGELARLGELPYQAGILIRLGQTAFCGGSIVSNNYVLSAASCFPSSPQVTIEIGQVNRHLVQEFIDVAQQILHPGHNNPEAPHNHDIALLRTVRPMVFSDNVRPVRLPNRRQVTQSFENQLGRMSGWGATGTGDSAPNQHLRVAFSRVISQLTCTIRFPNTVSANTICVDGENHNFCTGDFGGPLTIQDADTITTQIGVASFLTPLGCTRGLPGGFTRVSRYLDWIEENSDVVIRNDFN